MTARFAVFLSPSQADYVYFARLIEEFSSHFNVTPFEPHVTVYTGAFTNRNQLERNIADTVAGVSPFSLQVSGIGYSEEYFKSLFLEFQEQGLLSSISERLRESCGDSGYRLTPHLSLLYSDTPLEEKKKLPSRLTLDHSSFIFDSVKLVLSPEDGWRDTGRWLTLRRYNLGTLPLTSSAEDA